MSLVCSPSTWPAPQVDVTFLESEMQPHGRQKPGVQQPKLGYLGGERMWQHARTLAKWHPGLALGGPAASDLQRLPTAKKSVPKELPKRGSSEDAMAQRSVLHSDIRVLPVGAAAGRFYSQQAVGGGSTDLGCRTDPICLHNNESFVRGSLMHEAKWCGSHQAAVLGTSLCSHTQFTFTSYLPCNVPWQ